MPIFDAAPSRSTNTLSRQGPFAVHVDGDGVAGEHAGEGRTGELRARR
jgi:hypothetical protein